jgi:HSP20 family molecular chaperone IbpA
MQVRYDPATHMVTITGQRMSEKLGNEKSSVTFQRAFSLPADVDMDKPMAARTADGVLTLELPRAPLKPTPKPLDIPID